MNQKAGYCVFFTRRELEELDIILTVFADVSNRENWCEAEKDIYNSIENKIQTALEDN